MTDTLSLDDVSVLLVWTAIAVYALAFVAYAIDLARRSALAVEAAGQQGRFEDMYNKMFQNQSRWGESDVDKSDLFRTYAQEIGLDMEAYDAAIADPKSEERVMFDFEGGQALGVTGTPTVFINDTKTEIEDLASLDAAIAAALAE